MADQVTAVEDFVGEMDVNGMVTKHPRRYAVTGGPYNPLAASGATRIFLGEGRSHFCVVPIGMGNIPEDVRNNLETHIAQPIAAKATTVKKGGGDAS